MSDLETPQTETPVWQTITPRKMAGIIIKHVIIPAVVTGAAVVVVKSVIERMQDAENNE